MATKRFEGARFDHGAQHFSARGPEFTAEVKPGEVIEVEGTD